MRDRIDYFGIYFITFIGMSFFFLLPAVVVDIDGKIIAFLLGCVGVFSYLVGYKTKKYFKINILSFPNYIGYCARAILVYYLFIITVTLTSTVEVGSYTEGYANVNHFLLYTKILTVFFDILIYYVLSNYVGDNKKRYYLVAILSVLVNLKSNTRLDLLLPVIFWVGYGYYFNIIKVTFIRVFIVLLFTPVLFTALLLRRVMKGSFESYFEQMQIIYDYLSFDNLLQNIYVSMETFRSYELFIKIVDDGFIHIESGFLRIAFMFIPRSIWVDKPESVSRIISHHFYPEQYDGGGGTVANIFGDAYINGGVIGIILVLFFWGWITKVIYNSTIERLPSFDNDIQTKSFLISVYLVYVQESIQYYRGFMSESFWRLLYFITITILLSKILKKKDS